MAEWPKLKVNLKPYNTMALPAEADYFYSVNSINAIDDALDFAASKSLPVYVLGGGSNVIFNKDFPGLLIHMGLKGMNILEENEDTVLVEVHAGEVWDDFLKVCLQNQWYGLENLAIIPGQVGAAPIQNVGAYGQEVSDSIESVEAIEIATRQKQTFTNEACEFAYRDSIFKNAVAGKYLITKVCFRLSKQFKPNIEYPALKAELEVDDPTAEQVRNAVIKVRQSKLPDPAILPNTGSFFKNPVLPISEQDRLKKTHPDIPIYPVDDQHIKVAAGWLIEQCGWKGKSLKGVGMHKDQALVLVNHANATIDELLALKQAVQADVFETFGIQLEQEPILVG